MRKNTSHGLFLLIFFSFLVTVRTAYAAAEAKTDSINRFFYIKKEINKGFVLNANNEREEENTSETSFSDERYVGSARYQIDAHVYNFLDYKQEIMNLVFGVGPFFGNGNSFDNNGIEQVDADYDMYGIRANLKGNYESRFYYDQKNYTLVKVNAWLSNDAYWKNSSGTLLDSNSVSSNFKNEDFENKFRYGFQAKAGWGFGRLNPMNNYMVADYVLMKYYQRRVFSENEKENVSRKIAEIKQRRDPGVAHSPDAEIKELSNFLRSSMMLEIPNLITAEWELGEFLPRYNGSRVELGPFFNYYNREPDFYYGGYIQYNNNKYVKYSWNRNIGINASYSHYKHHNWASIETDFGWSYYPNLKTQVSFGLKYVPGMVIYSLDDTEPLRHNFIPYFDYFTQLNAKSRMKISFAWKIADGSSFMMSGPELSMSLYRSSY